MRLCYRLARGISRSDKFSRLEQHHLSWLKTNCSSLLEGDEAKPYLIDWYKIREPEGSVVLRPGTTAEVARLLGYCNQQRLAVVPQGGRTGLVEGSTPYFDEIVLEMGRMNKVLNFRESDGLLHCEAGCILQKLNEQIDSKGYEVPLDLGARGSCQIGGNVSTNAGGKFYVKHGSFKSHVLGLEVVLADGRVLDLKSGMKKDNTGYDLKQLFIGAEGTLGVVTQVQVTCLRKRAPKSLYFLLAQNYGKLLQGLPRALKVVGPHLSACEYLCGHAYHLVQKHVLGNVRHFSGEVKPSDHLLLIESSEEHDEEKLCEELQPFFKELLSATDGKTREQFWRVREECSEASRLEGHCHKFDVSVPVEQWVQLCEMIRGWGWGVTIGFGHFCDNNIHINVNARENSKQFQRRIYEFVVGHGGSISAEHGVGTLKAEYLGLQRSPLAIELMRGVKAQFDPRGILNPYKLFPK